MDKKFNLLLPIAGAAKRFSDVGYTMPKPLIMANNRHIIDWSMDSVKLDDCNIIFVVRAEHVYNFSIDEILKEKFGEDITIVVLDHMTRGSVETCLEARKFIENDMPLIIYTPDVYFQNQLDPETIDPNLDGFILTFKANSPAHSYVKLDKRGLATKTAEKEVISQDAAVGVYYYKTGDMFVKYAERLIHNDITVKNEFYLCPMYNLMIQDGLKIKTKSAEKMHVLGTPSELEFFTNYVVQRFGEKPVALCCDHSGYKLKEAAKKVLDANRVPYIDFGTLMNKNCDYNDYVSQAMQAIESKVCDFAMGFCRTGQGINILANTSKDIRGALVFDEYTAEYCIRHNCANFFTIPEKYVDKDELDRMVKIWLTSSFDGGRHMTRMKKTIG